MTPLELAHSVNRSNRRTVILKYGMGIFNSELLTSLDNPLSYSHSRYAHVDPASKYVYHLDCRWVFQNNRLSRTLNRCGDVPYNPLSRTMPWLLGTPYIFGEQPHLMTDGGIFPDTEEMLYNMNDSQMDELERFYGRPFMWPRQRSFWEFITFADHPEPERDPWPIARYH